MAAKSAIAWRNWCFEVGTAVNNYNFATVPPISNLTTPRTSELVFSNNIAADYAEFQVEWTGGRAVDMVAILNHNMLGPDTKPQVELWDSDGSTVLGTIFIGVNSINLEVQRHMYVLFEEAEDFDFKDVVKVIVTFPQRTGTIKYGKQDEWTEIYTPEQLSVGGLWAGPLWYPQNPFRNTGWGQGVTEVKRAATSIGGQEYRSPEPRRRRMPVSLPLLSQEEVYQYEAFPYSAQRIFNWLGTSQPLIAIPDINDAEATFLQAVYGYLDQDPQWTSLETAGYSVSLSITEAL